MIPLGKMSSPLQCRQHMRWRLVYRFAVSDLEKGSSIIIIIIIIIDIIIIIIIIINIIIIFIIVTFGM